MILLIFINIDEWNLKLAQTIKNFEKIVDVSLSILSSDINDIIFYLMLRIYKL